MIKLFLVSILSNISIFAGQAKEIDESMPWMIPWLVASLLIILLLFWSFYKAMQTKNPKYGYLIFLSIILLIGMIFL